MIRIAKWILGAAAVAVTIFPCPSAAQLPSAAHLKDDSPAIRRVVVSGGIELHYVERGTGVPVVFVHGSLSDGGYWNDQLGPFAASGYRAIAYSRRYNPPNTNMAQPGYSAATDADDLAALIEKLQLGKVHVLSAPLPHCSWPSGTPELVRTLVLAEAPAVSLLAYLPADQSELGRATLVAIQERMVKPMKTAFQKGDRAAGLRAFMDFVLDDPQAWDNMPEAARQDMLNHAHEWDIMMTAGELFPDLEPQAVRNITVPALLLSGEKSYRFLALIDEELARLLPHNRRIILHGATHRMWFEQPEPSRNAVLDFWCNQVIESESK